MDITQFESTPGHQEYKYGGHANFWDGDNNNSVSVLKFGTV